MKKKLLVLGFSSLILLASCGGPNGQGGVNPVRKDIDFKEIITKRPDITLINEQVKQGFNLLRTAKITSKVTTNHFDGQNYQEPEYDEYVTEIENFANGLTVKNSTQEKYNNSVFVNRNTKKINAFNDDCEFEIIEDSDEVFDDLDRTNLLGLISKQSAVLENRRSTANDNINLSMLFTGTNSTDTCNYSHNVIGKLSDTKIASYFESKNTSYFNNSTIADRTFSKVSTAYCYLEAEVKGDVYVITTLETKYQISANYVGTSSNFVKLDKFYKVAEAEVKYELQYNNALTDFADSTELTARISDFPSWYINSGSIVANVYLPVKDDSGNIIDVIDTHTTQTFNAGVENGDHHGFDTYVNGSVDGYLYNFNVVANASFYDSTLKITDSKNINEKVNVSGFTPTYTDGEGVQYYSVSDSAKIFKFSTGLSFDATTSEFSVSTLTVA